MDGSTFHHHKLLKISKTQQRPLTVTLTCYSLLLHAQKAPRGSWDSSDSQVSKNRNSPSQRRYKPDFTQRFTNQRPTRIEPSWLIIRSYTVTPAGTSFVLVTVSASSSFLFFFFYITSLWSDSLVLFLKTDSSCVCDGLLILAQAEKSLQLVARWQFLCSSQ